MWTLRQLFGGSRTASASPSAEAGVAVDATRADSRDTLPTEPAAYALAEVEAEQQAAAAQLNRDLNRDLDRHFSSLLLAVRECRPAEAEPAERSILQRLEDLAAAPGNQNLVPRLPAVLPKLMSLVRRDDVSVRELAEHLARDPALVGEVIRIANSPRYRTARPIESLQDAVVLVGQRGMHQLVTGVAMRPVFNAQQGRFSRSAGTHLWDQAERCAHACAYLRGGAPGQFEAYLAGMVANAGLIAALRVLDQHYQAQTPPSTLGFHEALLDVSAKLSASIARQWNFPDDVAEALTTRAIQPPVIEASELTVALRTADRVSKRHVLAPHTPAPADATGDAFVEPEGRCYRELERVFGAKTVN